MLIYCNQPPKSEYKLTLPRFLAAQRLRWFPDPICVMALGILGISNCGMSKSILQLIAMAHIEF